MASKKRPTPPEFKCEVCGGLVDGEYELIGCEKCGKMFGPCCNSQEDGICVQCI